LYSAVALLDTGTGAVLERYEYDAYGTVHVFDASWNIRSASAYGNPYTFTGRRLDVLDAGNLRQMYYRHRDYDFHTGRFLEVDPEEFVDGINRYEYTRSNPISLSDPSGLATVSCTCGSGDNNDDWRDEYFNEMTCCTCLAYSETGRTGQDCFEAQIAVMQNRQRSHWGDFRGENSFCDQANMRGRWEGGAGAKRYDSCQEAHRCAGTPGVHPKEWEQIQKAHNACAMAMAGRSQDPTNGAQFSFASGQTPAWMKRQEQLGNCEKVTVPGCSITEFWKCKQRPLAQ